MKDLKGRIAVVTGASRGLGPYIARALAREGAQVALVARSKDKLEAAAREVEALGVRAASIAADLSKDSDRKRVVERATEELGPIDILVNNAGVEKVSRFVDLELDDVRDMIETNLVAPLALSRLVMPGMIERGAGHIVQVASLAGKKGVPFNATYSATKAGLVEWTSAVRGELAGTGVQVSVVCPGFVSDAGMFVNDFEGASAPKLAGTSSPEDVARGVIHAIVDDVAEVLVSPGPTRLMLMMNAVAPDLTRRLIERMGVVDLFRKAADRAR